MGRNIWTAWPISCHATGRTGKHRLSVEAAKYIANAMAYDDVIRVADLKTRGRRFERIRGEMGTPDEAVLQLTEFMHPRAEEIAGMLPAGLGRRIEADPRWMKRLDRWFNKGRRLRTDRTVPFLMLYAVGGLRGYRRRTLRHAVEKEHLDGWLNTALGHLETDYDLAVEVVRCRRLVKGYSDTHARGPVQIRPGGRRGRNACRPRRCRRMAGAPA